MIQQTRRKNGQALLEVFDGQQQLRSEVLREIAIWSDDCEGVADAELHLVYQKACALWDRQFPFKTGYLRQAQQGNQTATTPDYAAEEARWQSADEQIAALQPDEFAALTAPIRRTIAQRLTEFQLQLWSEETWQETILACLRRQFFERA